MALKYEVCGTCEGTGTSSAYLGSYTRDEFDEAFDADEQQDYFAGRYDRKCEECEGQRVVKVATCPWPTTPAQSNALYESCPPCSEYWAVLEIAAERRAEQRLGA